MSSSPTASRASTDTVDERPAREQGQRAEIGGRKLPRSVIRLGAFLVVAAMAALLFPLAFTVVTLEEEQQILLGGVFDPATFVDDSWEAIQTAYDEQAVDMSVILSDMEPDDDGIATRDQLVGVAEQHGTITASEAHVYMVRVSGSVSEVDTSSSSGTAELQLDGYDGPISVRVYIGPTIPRDNTSVRDAAGFIDFGDFRDQTEYGRVGIEINNRVQQELFEPLDAEGLVGRDVTVLGAFSIRTFNLARIDLAEINIVPVQLEVG